MQLNKVYCGDSKEVLKTFPDDCVDMCMTSPPYYRIRDYGTATWEGGDKDCDHKPGSSKNRRGAKTSTLQGGKKTVGHNQEGYAGICGRCGAVRQDKQIGQEPSPEEYIQNLVEIFREVRRVLKPHGTLWLNMGDSYCNARPRTRSANLKASETIKGIKEDAGQARGGVERGAVPAGMKPKDMMGIPWAVAFALRADGWYLRQDIIWAKGGGMPESVTDRCTKSHEYLFMLSKNPTYYYDHEAIKTPLKRSSVARYAQDVENQAGSDRVPGKTNGTMKAVRKSNKQIGHGSRHAGFNDRWEALSEAEKQSNGANKRDVWELPDNWTLWQWLLDNAPAGVAERLYETFISSLSNKADVWRVTPKPFKGAHYATYPRDLPEPAIKAGTSFTGNCNQCGKPWCRITEKKKMKEPLVPGKRVYHKAARGRHGASSAFTTDTLFETITTGWEPTCKCPGSIPVPAVVLDPFSGAGTTLVEAKSQGRNFVGIELNPKNITMTNERMEKMFHLLHTSVKIEK